jgi:threonine/homoserine/homoserine lactone efflux protein
MPGSLWKAFLFGVVVAAAIGPIALLIFDTAARRGFAAGAFAGCGAALADLTWALLAFSGGALLLPLLADHAAAIRAGSALLLAGLGLAMLVRGAAAAALPAPRPAAASLLPVFLLTLVNPMTLVVFAGFAPQLPVAGSPRLALGLASALAAGSLLVQLGLAAAGAVFRAALPGARWQRAVRLAAALGILAFGIAGLIGAWRAA